MKRTNRNYQVTVAGASAMLENKASCIVDGMGTRIYNHDGSVAYASPNAVDVIEISSTEEDIPDPVEDIDDAE